MAPRLEVSIPGRPPLSLDLSEGKALVLGRSSEADLCVEGDPHLSRRHAELRLEGDRLGVRRLEGSSNPIYCAGRPSAAFDLAPGGSFTIGKTLFRFLASSPPPPSGSGAPVALKTLTAKDLYSMGSPSDRLRLSDLLELPELLRSRDRADFHAHLAALLRSSTAAAWACVVTEDGQVLGEDAASGAARYHPSRSLLRKALEDAPQPTLYCWSKPGAIKATEQQGLDWAVCAAARLPGGAAMVFYAAGPSGPDGGIDDALHRDRARFAGLVADVVGRSVALDRVATWEGRLERFFAAPVVSKILESPDLGDLEPRRAQSTLLFFDIRGFSRKAEDGNDELLATIGELRRVMTAMTGIILDEGGVVLQYMGDGLLASWNVPFEDPRHVDRACRAALRMTAALGEKAPGWACGIGLHTGEVVAGAIGSEQVFAYGVLGAVVNQASRIEGITKLLGTPVLASAEVARAVSPSVAAAARLGRYQPQGMTRETELFELTVPPGDKARTEALARGLAAFERGDWDQALLLLGELPPGDKPAAFLRALAQEHRDSPPYQWRGVIELSQK